MNQASFFFPLFGFWGGWGFTPGDAQGFLPAQELHLAVFGGPYGTWGLNLYQLYPSQTPLPSIMSLCPRTKSFKKKPEFGQASPPPWVHTQKHGTQSPVSTEHLYTNPVVAQSPVPPHNHFGWRDGGGITEIGGGGATDEECGLTPAILPTQTQSLAQGCTPGHDLFTRRGEDGYTL